MFNVAVLFHSLAVPWTQVALSTHCFRARTFDTDLDIILNCIPSPESGLTHSNAHSRFLEAA